MSTLPKLETPTYILTVPSTEQEISYRPYLVKEEKMLLLAAEAKDEKSMLNEVINIVKVCTFNKLDINTITLYDLEYIFLQLRIKSVGEKSEITVECIKDQVKYDTSVALNEIQLKWPDEDALKATRKKIMLNSDIGITISHIPALSLESLSKVENEADKLLTLVADCVVDIFNKDNIWNRADVTQSEILSFIDQFTNPQVQEIQEFIATAPELSHTITWKCKTCGHENKIELRGLSDFF